MGKVSRRRDSGAVIVAGTPQHEIGAKPLSTAFLPNILRNCYRKLKSCQPNDAEARRKKTSLPYSKNDLSLKMEEKAQMSALRMEGQVLHERNGCQYWSQKLSALKIAWDRSNQQ